ncbi:S8 family serine peptidase [Pedobacter cryoconitis]|uniref:Subtilisin family serine protease n=1 Tax=Pedobacter cryoconitis TaxID=188932 RepID=A0A7X0MJN2_9SPHI|nr:S8 family serine peptidase [Pedobacter cryoconitis]MBB6501662.1 subtilisin family serine protease [Pedobacter cryoconitis]
MIRIETAFKIKLIILFSIVNFQLYAQGKNKPSPNWQNMDLKTDVFFGISTKKAYNLLLKDKTPVPVVVAVIDGGVDITHQDLKSVVWTNQNEIPENGIDDDKNGYIDDVHGWNFLGSSKGSFHFDNLELIRSLREELKKDPQSVKAKDLQKEVTEKKTALENAIKMTESQLDALNQITDKIGKKSPDIQEFEDYRYRTVSEVKVLSMVVRNLKADPDFMDELEDKFMTWKNQVKYLININYDPRAGNAEFLAKYYGNGDVIGLEPSHGTHISGIIAARPNESKGTMGIARSAMIMGIQAIPDGDALDKDVASAIRYAADNGARIINLSINKAFSPDRKIVDEAVQYAMSKNLLIVHSAGNEGRKLDLESGFPSRNYLNGGKADSWIEVGASNYRDDENLLPWFSNYGKNIVDVFAPGVDIFSTYPGNTYSYLSGTSMAAPVVSGLAALIWSYYPKLTALQMKKIIMSSVVKVNHKVKSNDGSMIDFSALCISGGIVNAYNALEMADKENSL